LEKTQVVKKIKSKKLLGVGKRGMVKNAITGPGIKMEEMRALGKWRPSETAESYVYMSKL
jgi:hypothetical protein